MLVHNLHSNLVIFKYNTSIPLFSSHSIYIPIWWYSNLTLTDFHCKQKTIYIPIWWYSNANILEINKATLTNLHSNLVIFKFPFTPSTPIERMLFTFQSGDIQILYKFHFRQKDFRHLHSNLVIFKFIFANAMNCNIIEFTFQSGDIQIHHTSQENF